MHYTPHTDNTADQPSPFTLSTGPQSIAWLSSADPSGKPALSVFRNWQWVSESSPVIMFSAEQQLDGSRQATVVNAENTGWFVWNMATWSLREAVHLSSHTPPLEDDAFSHAGVSKAPCIQATCPRVAQSPVHFECRYLSTQRLPLGNEQRFVDLVFAEVVRVHVRDGFVAQNKNDNRETDMPLACIGANAFTHASEIISYQKAS